MLLIMLFLLPQKKAIAETEASVINTQSVKSKDISPKKLAYLVSDTRIPFWAVMARGIKNSADSLGYDIDIYSAANSAKRELEFMVKALKSNVSGIIVSPTNSSACVTILKFAKNAEIPVVISDIGTDSGEYVSYISSNNREGAYLIGKVLSNKFLSLGWKEGRVGVVAIPQTRLNGQERTAGFMQALEEAGIKGADIKQQVTFSEQETYLLSKEIIEKTPNLRAIWLQGSDRYNGALRAISETGNKDKILLLTFDAEPEFLNLIPQEVIVGAAMQQPFLMGQQAVQAMDQYLNGQPVKKNQQLPVLAISKENIVQQLPFITKNVFGLETQ